MFDSDESNIVTDDEQDDKKVSVNKISKPPPFKRIKKNYLEVQIVDLEYHADRYQCSKYILYGIDNETGMQLTVNVYNMQFIMYFDRYLHDLLEDIEDSLSYKSGIENIQLVGRLKYNFYGYSDKKISVWEVKLKSIRQMRKLCKAINLYDDTRTIYDEQYDEGVQFFKNLSIESFIRINKFEGQTNVYPSEISCVADDIEAIKIDKVLPMRVLCINIECLSSGENHKKSPNAENAEDVIIQIGTSFSVFNPIITDIVNVIFCLHDTNKIDLGTVVVCQNEEELLKKFIDYIGEKHPDIITGYEILKFDMDYIIKRLKKYDMEFYTRRASRINNPWICCNVRPSSTKTGNSQVLRIKSSGIIFFDMFVYIQRNYKLQQCSLDFVCSHFFKETKPDMPYDQKQMKYRSGPAGRADIAKYCIQDCILVLKLMSQLEALLTYTMYAHVAGVPLKYIIERGQQIRVMTMIEREVKDTFIIPTLTKYVGGRYQGAKILEPQCGLYDSPVITLDFTSFYPSIMIAHNLCYSTFIDDPSKKSTVDCFETPIDAQFVKESVREGVLPKILNRLLKNRSDVCKRIKKETDPGKLAILNGMEIALKVSANSIYGFTGAISTSKLPCVEISASVTGYGRKFLEISKEIIEKRSTRAVIYGDTDSIMIKDSEINTVEEAIKLGKILSTEITREINQPPISIKFEKVYYPYLLMKKRHYAGVHWTRPEKYDKVDIKGIERRDNCIFVNTVLLKCMNIILLQPSEKRQQILSNYLDSTLKPIYTAWIKKKTITSIIDINQFIITKLYSKEVYKTKQPHVAVVERDRKKNPHLPLPIGERIQYIICTDYEKKTTSVNQRLFERAFTNDEMMEKPNLVIDIEYYLKKKIFKSLEQFLSNTNIDISGYLDQKFNKMVIKPEKKTHKCNLKKKCNCEPEPNTITNYFEPISNLTRSNS